jgi:hypothetical protein
MGLHRHGLPWVFTHTYGPYLTTKCPSPSRLTVLQTQLKYSTLTHVLHPRATLSAPLPPWRPCAPHPSSQLSVHDCIRVDSQLSPKSQHTQLNPNSPSLHPCTGGRILLPAPAARVSHSPSLRLGGRSSPGPY